jgi:hypothetical protein
MTNSDSMPMKKLQEHGQSKQNTGGLEPSGVRMLAV